MYIYLSNSLLFCISIYLICNNLIIFFHYLISCMYLCISIYLIINLYISLIANIYKIVQSVLQNLKNEGSRTCNSPSIFCTVTAAK